ncbi:unnamed protein product [Rhodiola kirilowii]
MDSNYSALSRDAYVELQKFNAADPNQHSSIRPHIKLLPLDEQGFAGSPAKLGDDDDDDDDDDDFDIDIDIDNYPAIIEAKSSSGIAGAVFNLTTSIIGAGIMALPATMKVLGLVLGFLLIIFVGILSEISVEMLVRYSVLSKSSSYGEVVQHALGRKAG